MTPPRSTPPFGLRKQSTTIEMLADRLGVVESDVKSQGNTLAKVETKVDILIDLHRQDREDRQAAAHHHLAETAKTERVRIGSRAKTIAATVAAIGGAVAAYLAGSAGCA